MSNIRRSTLAKTAIAVTCCLVVNGCAIDPKTGRPSFKETFNSDDPCANNARNIGILAGTIVGGVIGSQIDKKSGILVGAGMGALLGGVIGADMDRKKCELSKLAKKYDLDMTISDVKLSPGAAGAQADPNAEKAVGLSVSITDHGENGHFRSGSDQLLPNAEKYFSEIAAEYSYRVQLSKLPANAGVEARQAVESLKEKRILIVGHTDDTGNSRLNADLSERRAKALARIFRAAGISEANIYFQGAGETLPIADNRSEEGRAKNRRVEIVDLTDQASFQSYLATRPVRTDYYRVAPAPMAASATASAPAPTKPAAKQAANPAGKQPLKSAKSAPAAHAPQPERARTASGADTAKTAASSTVNAPRRANAADAIDFGGVPVGMKPAALDIGQLVTSRSLANLISPAQADDLPSKRSCADDRPRISNGVKSLRDAKQFETSDYMPGLYDTSWSDKVNNHLVALTHVAVLRDGGAPARKPQLLIYKDFKGGSPKPSYSANPEVNAYKGEKAVLYRVFVDGPVRCMDIVIPNASPTEAKGSWLYYDGDGQQKITSFNPRIAR